MIWAAVLICLVNLAQASLPSLADIVSRKRLCLGENAHCPVSIYKNLDLCCKPLVCTAIPKTRKPNFINRYFKTTEYKDRRCLSPTESSNQSANHESFESTSMRNNFAITTENEFTSDSSNSTDTSEERNTSEVDSSNSTDTSEERNTSEVASSNSTDSSEESNASEVASSNSNDSSEESNTSEINSSNSTESSEESNTTDIDSPNSADSSEESKKTEEDFSGNSTDSETKYKMLNRKDSNSETDYESVEEITEIPTTEPSSVLDSHSYSIDDDNEIRVKRYISNDSIPKGSLSLSSESLEGRNNYTDGRESQFYKHLKSRYNISSESEYSFVSSQNTSSESEYSFASSQNNSSESEYSFTSSQIQFYNSSSENESSLVSSQRQTNASEEYSDYASVSRSGEFYDYESNETMVEEQNAQNLTSNSNLTSSGRTVSTTPSVLSEDDWHSSDMKADSRPKVFKIVTVRPLQWIQTGAQVVKLNLSSEISE